MTNGARLDCNQRIEISAPRKESVNEIILYIVEDDCVIKFHERGYLMTIWRWVQFYTSLRPKSAGL